VSLQWLPALGLGADCATIALSRPGNGAGFSSTTIPEAV
jgi:hypothetical protein